MVKRLWAEFQLWLAERRCRKAFAKLSPAERRKLVGLIAGDE